MRPGRCGLGWALAWRGKHKKLVCWVSGPSAGGGETVASWEPQGRGRKVARRQKNNHERCFLKSQHEQTLDDGGYTDKTILRAKNED